MKWRGDSYKHAGISEAEHSRKHCHYSWLDVSCTEMNPAGLCHHPGVADISKIIQSVSSVKDLGRSSPLACRERSLMQNKCFHKVAQCWISIIHFTPTAFFPLSPFFPPRGRTGTTRLRLQILVLLHIRRRWLVFDAAHDFNPCDKLLALLSSPSNTSELAVCPPQLQSQINPTAARVYATNRKQSRELNKGPLLRCFPLPTAVKQATVSTFNGDQSYISWVRHTSTAVCSALKIWIWVRGVKFWEKKCKLGRNTFFITLFQKKL